MTTPDWSGSLPSHAIGYAYTPAAALWFRVSSDGPTGPDAQTIDLNSAFHVRVFDGKVDLTWERAGHKWAHRRLELADGTDSLPTTARLWGTVERTLPGWAYLREDRITGFWVPTTQAPLNATLALTQRECLNSDDNGNVYVAHTLLVGIEVDHV